MQIAMIGLGKMGANMTTRLLNGGHSVVAYDLKEDAIKAAEAEGATGARTLEELREYLLKPRTAWIMVPSGHPTEDTIYKLARVLEPGDVIIDGGNSFYKDTLRRAKIVQGDGLELIDAGTSGGIWGLSEGYSLMVGGSKETVKRISPIFETLAPAKDKGWGHVGPVGSGHFVKMVHNGIEYGLMQAYAEGFELMGRKEEFGLDLHQIAEIWRHGSVVRSWLLDLTANALSENPKLEGIEAYVPDSGEGRWTVMEAIELATSVPVISLALQERFSSRENNPFSDRLLSALRNQFGGHSMKPAESKVKH
ncbi:MAG: decarboxylating 6-phosphogluconate dehydrogenase [Trueperaceae bacterium]|nr:decarboxylating 6-phosphogluconate dehydrogenase [Trueperaceae bacterium]